MKAAVATVGDLPAADPSINGEVHFVTGTGDLYICDGTTWTNMGHVAGPQGPTGPAGTNGTSINARVMSLADYNALSVTQKTANTLFLLVR